MTRTRFAPTASIRFCGVLALAATLASAAEAIAWPHYSALSPGAICPGDCNYDGVTSVDELLVGVGLLLGGENSGACLALYPTPFDTSLGVADLVAAVATGLHGCPTARWVPGNCPPLPAGQDPATARCGALLVPENRATGTRRALRLETVVLRATGPQRAPDPLVFLTGGPGSAALEGPYLASLTAAFAAPIQATRDIVIFNQRGTGTIDPWYGPLDCPEVQPLHLRFAERLSPAEEAAAELDEVRGCLYSLTRRGIDLTAYTSVATARDIADLMAALDYERYNIYGLSYGSRVALTALRDLPGDRIRSVVLDGAVPPQVSLVSGVTAAAVQAALERLFADCAAQPACDAAYSDLAATTYALLDRLNAEPLRFTAVGPEGPFDVVLTGDRVVRLLWFGLQSNATIPLLPLAVASMARGDTSVAALAVGALAAPEPYAIGLAHAVICNEETPFHTPAVLAAAEAGVHPALARAMAADPLGSTCPLAGVGATDPVENQAVASAVPALVLAGDYDPSTPPAFGQLAAATLANGHYVELRGYGHVAVGQEVASGGGCAVQLIAAFLANPTRAPDRGCADALTAPRFIGG